MTSIEAFADRMLPVVVYTVIAIGCAFAGYYGLLRGGDWFMSLSLMIFGVCAVVLEAIAAHKIARNIRRRLWGAAACSFIVWFACATYGLWGAFAVAAKNQDNTASLRTAAYQTQEETKDRKAELIALIGQAKSDVAWNPNVPPLGVSQAKIDAAKAHRFWTSTASCTAPKGPQTRKFCAEYRQAEADFASGERKLSLEANVSTWQTELNGLRDRTAAASVITSEATPVVRLIGDMTGASVLAVDLGQAVQITITVMVIITLAAFMSGMPVREPRPPTDAAHAEHPDLEASLRAQAQALAAKASEMRTPLDEARRRLLTGFSGVPGQPSLAATGFGTVDVGRLAAALGKAA
jgi:hypothetical protein